MLNIVLVAPDIPGNTGSIGRTCVALDLTLILIKPYGFDLSTKAVKRAGLDYWKYLKLKQYDSWQNFFQEEQPEISKLFFFSKQASQSFYEANYQPGSYLVFGSETQGLPTKLFQEFPKSFWRIPMLSQHVRSLNLANSVTAVCYQALRPFL